MIASIIRSAGDELVDRRDAREHLVRVRRPSQPPEALLDRREALRDRARDTDRAARRCRPDAATTCAIPPPICPAPTTSTCSKSIGAERTVARAGAHGNPGGRTPDRGDPRPHLALRVPGRCYRRSELDAMPIDETRWAHRINETPPGWDDHRRGGRRHVVGFASTGPSRDQLGIGELYAIYVEPDAWSTGAGRELIVRAEAELGENVGRGHALGSGSATRAPTLLRTCGLGARRRAQAGDVPRDGGRRGSLSQRFPVRH